MIHSMVRIVIVSAMFITGSSTESHESRDVTSWSGGGNCPDPIVCPDSVTAAERTLRDTLLIKYFSTQTKILNGGSIGITEVKALFTQDATFSITPGVVFTGSAAIAAAFFQQGPLLGISGIQITPVPDMIKYNVDKKENYFYVELVASYSFRGTPKAPPFKVSAIYFFRTDKELKLIAEVKIYSDYTGFGVAAVAAAAPKITPKPTIKTTPKPTTKPIPALRKSTTKPIPAAPKPNLRAV